MKRPGAAEMYNRTRDRYPRTMERLRYHELAERAQDAVVEPEGVDLGPLSHAERNAILFSDGERVVSLLDHADMKLCEAQEIVRLEWEGERHEFPAQRTPTAWRRRLVRLRSWVAGSAKRMRPTLFKGSLITLLILTLGMIYMSGGR